MKTKRKDTAKEIYKKYKQRKNSLEEAKRKRFLTSEAYDYNFAMIGLVEKNSNLHILLLRIEDVLKNESKILIDLVKNCKISLDSFYKSNKRIINKLREEDNNEY